MNTLTFPINVRFYKNAVSLFQETKVSEFKFVYITNLPNHRMITFSTHLPEMNVRKKKRIVTTDLQKVQCVKGNK